MFIEDCFQSSAERTEDSPKKHLIEIPKHMLGFQYFSVRVRTVSKASISISCQLPLENNFLCMLTSLGKSPTLLTSFSKEQGESDYKCRQQHRQQLKSFLCLH